MLTIGQFRMTKGHIFVTNGQFRMTKGHIFVTNGQFRKLGMVTIIEF